jgi:poly-gamma-glutamate synthesis protein (capsule biosynthesis protein)
VVHPTRPVADVPVAQARALVRDGVTRWSAVGQIGGRMRVISTLRGRSAREVLRAVGEDDRVLGVLPASEVDPSVRVLEVGGRHPLRDPARYPLEIPARTEVPEVTTVSVVGDIMLGRRVGRAAAAAGDAFRSLRPLADRLASAEITVGNFESTLSDNGPATQGGDSFAADPDVLPGLQRAGFDVLTLANNHVGDYGDRAMRQTFREFERADLATVGAGRDLSAARAPVVIERDGVSVGFLATDSIGETPAATTGRAGTNRLDMPPRTGPFDEGDLRRITGDIEALADRVDTVVVLTHWGTQYTHRPEPSQRRAARAFAAAGADLVIGGHPHWVQGWERIGATPVVHSLGNFIFDMDFAVKTRQGVFVEIVLWGGTVKAVEPVPYVIGDDFAPRPVRGARAQRILDDVWSTSRGPWARP